MVLRGTNKLGSDNYRRMKGIILTQESLQQKNKNYLNYSVIDLLIKCVYHIFFLTTLEKLGTIHLMASIIIR